MSKWKVKGLSAFLLILPILLILLSFIIPTFAIPQPPVVVNAETTTTGEKVLITFDKEMSAPPAAPAGFSVTVDGEDNPVILVGLNANPAKLELSVTDTVYANASDIKVSYIAGTVTSVDEGILESFSNQAVTNNSTVGQTNNSTITPIEATFDKKNPVDITVTMELNGNILIALKNGEDELVSGTDYTVSGSDVIISQAYLATQSQGTSNIIFDFSTGNDPVLIVTVVDTTPQPPVVVNAETTTTGDKVLITFDKEMATPPTAPAGFSVTVDGEDNSIILVGLNANPAKLELSVTDTVYASASDIKVSYIAGTGVTSTDEVILESFSNQAVTNNSTVGQTNNSTITPIEATFDKKNPVDITVTMELNGNILIALKNGEDELVSGTDYTVSGSDVIISQAYLARLPQGTSDITFDFNTGNDPVLIITVADTIPQPPVVINAEITTTGDKVLITFDKEMATPPTAPAGFSVTVDGEDNPIILVGLNANPAKLELSVTDTVYASASDIRVSYIAGTVTSADEGILEGFSNQAVTNNSTVMMPVLEYTYIYDNQNRLDYIELSTGQKFDYQYDINGNLINIVLVN